jgi:hypothetical protein
LDPDLGVDPLPFPLGRPPPPVERPLPDDPELPPRRGTTPPGGRFGAAFPTVLEPLIGAALPRSGALVEPFGVVDVPLAVSASLWGAYGAPFRCSRNHCCPIWIAFVVVQYTTKPAGKKYPQTPKSSGMTFMIVCC